MFFNPILNTLPVRGAEFNITMNYAPLTGAKFVLNINVGVNPYAILCRPYGTCRLLNFHRIPIVINTLFNISSTSSVHNPMFMHTSALPHPGTLTTRSPVHPLPTCPQHPTRQRHTPTPVKTTLSVDNSAKHCLSIKRYY